MKYIFFILFLAFSLNLSAQRDTLIESIAYDSDTLTYSFSGDSTYTYRATNALDLDLKIRESDELQVHLDSVLQVLTALIQEYEQRVEAIHLAFRRENSYLWNLRKEYARIEDFYNTIYP